jgi:hypothetical protein
MRSIAKAFVIRCPRESRITNQKNRAHGVRALGELRHADRIRAWKNRRSRADRYTIEDTVLRSCAVMLYEIDFGPALLRARVPPIAALHNLTDILEETCAADRR